MKFASPLLEGTLLSRYKRFFADVEYNGEKITIHVPNTGSLKSVINKESKKPQKVWFSLHNNPEKKLKGTLEAIQTSSGVWVGVNTSNPNKIVTEAIQLGIRNKKSLASHWELYQFYKPEYKISKETRLDGAFFESEIHHGLYKDISQSNVKAHFVEIKNTTYLPADKKTSVVQFPDSVTERGQKHLIEMMTLMKKGHTCEIIYTIQRNDAEHFSTCVEHDPVYSKLFHKAMNAGLIISPLVVHLDRDQIYLTDKKLPLA